MGRIRNVLPLFGQILGRDKVLCAFLMVYLAVAFFLYQSASLGTPVCFDDCLSYIVLMGKSRSEYLDGFRKMFRPWTVPVFFSAFGQYSMASATRITLVQTYLGYLSWIVFAYACQSFLSGRWIRLLAFVLISSLMFGQGYYHYNQYLLSDSVALSLVLIQFALCLLLRKFAGICSPFRFERLYIALYLLVLIAVSGAEMAARDSNILLTVCGIGFLILSGPLDRKISIYSFLLLVVVGAFAYKDASHAQNRHSVNAENILVAAVLPSEDLAKYFVDQGMPAAFMTLAPSMKPQDLGQVNIDEVIDGRKAFDKKEWGVYLPLIDHIYIKFLVTHPGYVLANASKYRRLIFGQDVGQILGFSPPVGGDDDQPVLTHPGLMAPFAYGDSFKLSVIDYVPFWVLLILTTSYLLYIATHFSLEKSWPIFLAALGASNALLGFFGDVWGWAEMARHATIGSVLFRTAALACALFLIDDMCRRFRRDIKI